MSRKMHIEVVTDAKEGSVVVKKLTNDFDKLDIKVKKASHSLGLLKTAMVGALGVWSVNRLKDIAKEWAQVYAEYERAEKIFVQSIYNVGRYSLVFERDMNALVNHYQKTTAFHRTIILDGLKILATFDEISTDILPRATQAMIDYAAFTGVSMESAAKAIGKASMGLLGDLKRVGAQVRETTYQYKGFLGVLGELELQMSGQAMTFAKSPAGYLMQIENAIKDIKIAVGEGIFQLAKGFDILGKYKEILMWIQDIDWGKWGEGLGKVLAAIFTQLGEWLKKLVELMKVPLIAMLDILGKATEIANRIESRGRSPESLFQGWMKAKGKLIEGREMGLYAPTMNALEGRELSARNRCLSAREGGESAASLKEAVDYLRNGEFLTGLKFIFDYGLDRLEGIATSKPLGWVHGSSQSFMGRSGYMGMWGQSPAWAGGGLDLPGPGSMGGLYQENKPMPVDTEITFKRALKGAFADSKVRASIDNAFIGAITKGILSGTLDLAALFKSVASTSLQTGLSAVWKRPIVEGGMTYGQATSALGGVAGLGQTMVGGGGWQSGAGAGAMLGYAAGPPGGILAPLLGAVGGGVFGSLFGGSRDSTMSAEEIALKNDRLYALEDYAFNRNISTMGATPGAPSIVNFEEWFDDDMRDNLRDMAATFEELMRDSISKGMVEALDSTSFGQFKDGFKKGLQESFQSALLSNIQGEIYKEVISKNYGIQQIFGAINNLSIGYNPATNETTTNLDQVMETIAFYSQQLPRVFETLEPVMDLLTDSINNLKDSMDISKYTVNELIDYLVSVENAQGSLMTGNLAPAISTNMMQGELGRTFSLAMNDPQQLGTFSTMARTYLDYAKSSGFLSSAFDQVMGMYDQLKEGPEEDLATKLDESLGLNFDKLMGADDANMATLIAAIQMQTGVIQANNSTSQTVPVTVPQGTTINNIQYEAGYVPIQDHSGLVPFAQEWMENKPGTGFVVKFTP